MPQEIEITEVEVVANIAIFLFLTSFSSFGQESVEKSIQVIVGIDEVEKLSFKPSTKVEVGNDAILSYTLIPDDNIREITFKGLKPGKTSLIVRDNAGTIRARYRVNVISNDLSKTVIKLREFFEDIEGVEVKIKGGSVVVEGKIIVPDDIGKIKVILDREEFKNDVIALIELSPQTQRIVAKRMQEEIQKAGIRNVSVRVVNKQYWLEGFVTRNGDRQRAEDIATGLLPDKLDSIAVISGAVSALKRDDIRVFISTNIKQPPQPLPKLVKIVAQFVELTKDYDKAFGFKWEPALSGDGGNIQVGRVDSGGVSTRSSGTLSATISNLFPKLSSAKSAGNARIIQQGMVIVKDRTPAHIDKTTTTPFAVGGGDFARPQDASAGFQLDVTPTITTDNNIEMNINLKISEVTTNNPPVTTANNIRTVLHVAEGESAAIGGISFNSQSTSFDRDPPFGQTQFGQDESGQTVQPIFAFIRSKSFVDNRSQFVVFLTPDVVDSASKGTEDIKRKFKKRRR